MSAQPILYAGLAVAALCIPGIFLGHHTSTPATYSPPAAVTAPAPAPNLVAAVLTNPGLCAGNVSAGLRFGGDAAKANDIDAACAAVQTHNETGRWPTGYAP